LTKLILREIARLSTSVENPVKSTADETPNTDDAAPNGDVPIPERRALGTRDASVDWRVFSIDKEKL
jgi:hypothetical protein